MVKYFSMELKNTVPQCKRAEVVLYLGSGKKVNYSWIPKDFNGNTVSDDPKSSNYSHHDHCYAAHPNSEDPKDDDSLDVGYSSIFDSNGNWQQKHKRRIIHVMDSYQISYEAYHELRHAGQGHFPPLRQIMKEKIQMSAEIPYIKHETVR